MFIAKAVQHSGRNSRRRLNLGFDRVRMMYGACARRFLKPQVGIVALVGILASAALEADKCDGCSPATLANSSEIGGQVATSASGLVSVNQASGNHNQQTNVTAIAITSGDGRVSAGTSHRAMNDNTGSADPSKASHRVSIRDSSFSHSAGAISVNQAAGNSNQQYNARVIGVGAFVEVSDGALLQVSPAAGVLEGSRPLAPLGGLVTIGDGTFAGASGLIQINQAAGVNNATANVFVATVEFGSGAE